MSKIHAYGNFIDQPLYLKSNKVDILGRYHYLLKYQKAVLTVKRIATESINLWEKCSILHQNIRQYKKMSKQKKLNIKNSRTKLFDIKTNLYICMEDEKVSNIVEMMNIHPSKMKRTEKRECKCEPIKKISDTEIKYENDFNYIPSVPK
ncbi:hypothetical protein A3Q56_01282 [Intoshia linei]|uniref:Uncharacterized protein n=1 Tax=Intoshia linei TaxID=1819745 RepID=A0A177BBE3_9BILA|nr:hypothetical protein A3Q56_01282 [Intoshia linei]